MILLLLKILLAHFIGDFFLQPQKWVSHKEKKKLKSIWLYVHIAVHITLLCILVWDTLYTLTILTIGLSHLIIDAIKLTLQRKKTKRLFFFIDQALHLISIFIITYLFYNQLRHNDYIFNINLNKDLLLVLLCVVFLTKPTSIIMKTIFSKWDISKLTKGKTSLKDAGTYIGVLERLLVFVFIVVGQWEAVGFLLTAKSVFRFGDLTAAKERKLTEYILIGTLISFGIAITISLLYITLKNYV